MRWLEWRYRMADFSARLAVWDWHDTFKRVVWVFLLPFRLIVAVWQFGAAAGRMIITGALQFCLVVLGLSFFAILSFGLIRVILHPLFR